MAGQPAPGRALRVVSLLPSATETLLALRAAAGSSAGSSGRPSASFRLVGVTHECPAAAGARVLTSPKVGGPAEAAAGPAGGDPGPGLDSDGDLDAAHGALGAAMTALFEMQMVQEGANRLLLEFGLGVFRTDLDALRDAAPDVVLTQLQGAGEEDGWAQRLLREHLRRHLGGGSREVRVVHLACGPRLAEVWEEVAAIGAAVGLSAERLLRGCRRRMETCAAMSRGRRRRRVGVLQWLEPLYAAGAWVPEMVALAGGEDVLAGGGAGAGGALTEDGLRAAAPDVLIFSICGKTLAENRDAAARFLARSKGAPRAGKVFCCDGTRCLSVPGPALATSAEALWEMLWEGSEAQVGSAGGFGHRGTWWDSLALAEE